MIRSQGIWISYRLFPARNVRKKIKMKINFYQTLKELSVACEFLLNCVNLVLGLEYLILNPWNPLRKNWFIFMAFERLSVYWKICKWQNRKISDVRPRARAHSPKIDTMTHIVKMKKNVKKWTKCTRTLSYTEMFRQRQKII